jgi:hypothetical protein
MGETMNKLLIAKKSNLLYYGLAITNAQIGEIEKDLDYVDCLSKAESVKITAKQISAVDYLERCEEAKIVELIAERKAEKDYNKLVRDYFGKNHIRAGFVEDEMANYADYDFNGKAQIFNALTADGPIDGLDEPSIKASLATIKEKLDAYVAEQEIEAANRIRDAEERKVYDLAEQAKREAERAEQEAKRAAEKLAAKEADRIEKEKRLAAATTRKEADKAEEILAQIREEIKQAKVHLNNAVKLAEKLKDEAARLEANNLINDLLKDFQ